MNSIGRYQLTEKLGQGGMGVVYRAFDTLLQRVVAVKIISGAIEPGSEQRERFFREARAAGKLSHRNIITIHDLGEHEGQPYLAMEFLEGEDLLHRLGGPNQMGLSQKVDLAIEICEGLGFAHAGGVVHRDIKPANIFITTAGTVKILDFGLARLASSDLTNSNMIMGTINYMAPEQVRGERVDHRADIFSLGVLLYELFGGRRAFHGESLATTLYKILHEVPEPLRQIDPNLPADLVAIVDRALAKSLDERYQQVADLLRDLKASRRHMADYDALTIVQPVSPVSAAHEPTRTGSSVVHDGPTIAQQPTQLQPHVSQPGTVSAPPASAQAIQPASVAQPAAPQASTGRRNVWAITAAAIVIILAAGLWIGLRPGPTTEPASASPAGMEEPEAVTAAVRLAVRALEAGSPSDAQRHADAALALAPGHAEAGRIRTQAADTIANVNRELGEARAHFTAGRFDEASKAAGNVLSLVPGHEEARQVMQDASGRLRGRGADEARRRMIEAKNAARAAEAVTLAAPAYNAALAAERNAQRAYDAGDLAGATATFYEASGLFRSAEVSAQSEAAARAQQARVAQDRSATPSPAKPAVDTRPPPAPEPPPADPKSAEPKPPDPRLTKPAAPAEPPPAASAENLIGELIGRYEAALENRNLAALKRLWPGLGGAQESAIRTEFDRASQIAVGISGQQIAVAGETATVTFLRQYEVTFGGQRVDSRSRTTMTLRRAGGEWVIEQVRFEPVR